VGYGLATAAAGFLVDVSEVRWHVHPEGWPERVTLGDVAAVVVEAGHPWQGQDGVEVVASADEMISRAVSAVCQAVAPIVDACHRLARVGRVGLWNEVADALGCTLAHQTTVPVTPAMVAVIEAAVNAPGHRGGPVRARASSTPSSAGSTLRRRGAAVSPPRAGTGAAWTRGRISTTTTSPIASVSPR
jgi:hypothetical protein